MSTKVATINTKVAGPCALSHTLAQPGLLRRPLEQECNDCHPVSKCYRRLALELPATDEVLADFQRAEP